MLMNRCPSYLAAYRSDSHRCLIVGTIMQITGDMGAVNNI